MSKQEELEQAMDKLIKEYPEHQTITASELLKRRTALVNRYGKKIITEPEDSNLLTLEEKAAKIFYEVMSKKLHEITPETKPLDELTEFYAKQGVNSVFGLIPKYLTKVFWPILGILVLLALIKFVFS